MALADSTRREIIELLARDGATNAGDIADRFASARPTISRHLRVLREAGLVTVTSVAQERRYDLDVEQLARTEAWLARHRRFWNDRLARLERALKEHP